MGYIKRKSAPRRRRQVRRRKVARRNVTRQKTHFFKRTIYVPNWVNTIPLSDTAFNFNPQLSDVPQHAEFTKLFDRYSIKGASFKLIPRFNVSQAQPAGVTPPPPSQIMTCFDFSGSGPTTIQDILQYENLRTTRGTQVHQRYLKPAVLNMAYETTISTAYVPKWGQFIDTVNDAVPHYGLYGMIPACGMTFQYDLQATYYLAMKNVK